MENVLKNVSCPSHTLANLWGCSVNGKSQGFCAFPLLWYVRKKTETKQTAVVQDCSIFNADIKGEQMPGWHRRGKIFIKKINNTERHKRKKSHTPSLPDYCMLKWHAYTIEQSAFIHRLNRDKGVPTGVLRCLECSSMQIYREREETVWGDMSKDSNS